MTALLDEARRTIRLLREILSELRAIRDRLDMPGPATTIVLTPGEPKEN